MKKALRTGILVVGLTLLLAALVVYGLQVYRNAPPIGSSPQQIDQLAQQYGTDAAFIQQYGLFLMLFLPGLLLVAIFGTIGINDPDNPVGLVPKTIIVLVLLTNVITALNGLAVASKAIIVSPPAFWMFLGLATLGLANFAFLLAIWNAKRWGLWAYGIAASLMFILKFAGSVPIIPSIIELSAVVVLIYLIRPMWNDMD